MPFMYNRFTHIALWKFALQTNLHFWSNEDPAIYMAVHTVSWVALALGLGLRIRTVSRTLVSALIMSTGSKPATNT